MSAVDRHNRKPTTSDRSAEDEGTASSSWAYAPSLCAPPQSPPSWRLAALRRGGILQCVVEDIGRLHLAPPLCDANAVDCNQLGGLVTYFTAVLSPLGAAVRVKTPRLGAGGLHHEPTCDTRRRLLLGTRLVEGGALVALWSSLGRAAGQPELSRDVLCLFDC